MKRKILLLCFMLLFLTACGKIVFGEIKLDLSNIDVNKIGNYEAVVIYRGEKINVPVSVVDTTAPIIVRKEVQFLEGTKITASDLVDVLDQSETELVLYRKNSEICDVALQEAFVFCGDSFLIKAVDKYGNETIEEIEPSVIEMKEEDEPAGIVDAEDYLYKIWVLDESTNEEYVSDFTFVINSVSQNEIKGRVMIYQAHEMEAGKHKRSTTLDGNTSGWDFIGTITENCAQCRFVNGNGQEGSLYIWFLSDGRVEATARYNDDKLNYNIIERSRFSPYNISDLGEEFQLTKSFGVTIDFYGDVYIMCGRFNNLGNGKFFPVAYLTDRNGNIFYKFDANFAIDIVDADIKDFNGDGKTDVKLLTDYEDDELGTPEHIFIQIENGFFEWHMQYSKDRTYY